MNRPPCRPCSRGREDTSLVGHLLQCRPGALTEDHSLQGSMRCCFCLSLSRPCSASHFSAVMPMLVMQHKLCHLPHVCTHSSSSHPDLSAGPSSETGPAKLNEILGSSLSAWATSVSRQSSGWEAGLTSTDVSVLLPSRAVQRSFRRIRISSRGSQFMRAAAGRAGIRLIKMCTA